jgi:diguanylate cyclase (GGDEF)-like protein
MQMSPPIAYDPFLFVLSVIIAIAASLSALWIAFNLRKTHFSVAIFAKLGSALVMGLAITGMHYTGMAAAQFAPESVSLAIGATGGMQHSSLALTIGIITICILIITLSISALDSQFAVRYERIANSLQEANEQLRNLALYDNLTGLPNRILLEDRMEQAVTFAKRNRNHFALMFVDLDQFKPVNDSYGHDVGDELLKSVAQRLNSCIRKSDTVARTGGDEFIIVLSEINKRDDAGVVCSKVLDELSRPFFIMGNEIEISGSIGISVYPKDGEELDTLKANADIAMYHAKKEGRNKFIFFSPEMLTK